MIKQHRIDPFIGYPNRHAKGLRKYRRKYWKRICPYSTRCRLCARVMKTIKRKNKSIACLATIRANMRKFGD